MSTKAALLFILLAFHLFAKAGSTGDPEKNITKPVLIILLSNQCPYCEKFNQQLLNDVSFKQGIHEKYKLLSFEISSESGKTVASQFQVKKVPAFIVLNDQQQRQQIFTGYSNAGKLAALLQFRYSTTAITAAPTSATCGNGLVESGEGCDDGNTSNGDGCDAGCNVELGYQCTGQPSVCQQISTCGNGILEMGESCDDNNMNNGDGCTSTCIIEPGFQCTGQPSVCQLISTCGNGIVESGEACDDNNMNNGDGCTSTCNIEPGFVCMGEPSVCQPISTCGNGIIESGEACDDGDQADGDGCSSTCNIETGYQCTGQPSVCQPLAICGNGIIESGEACDDGNLSNGDGCSSSCSIDAGWVCTGQPSVCFTNCGNGILEAGEECDDGNQNNGDGCNSACRFETNPQGVAVNQDNTRPHPSAMLDVKSNDKGMLIPRLSTAERTAIANPAKGLLVYDTSTNSFWFYNGSIWKQLASL